jgi:hypothetical protein
MRHVFRGFCARWAVWPEEGCKGGTGRKQKEKQAAPAADEVNKKQTESQTRDLQ